MAPRHGRRPAGGTGVLSDLVLSSLPYPLGPRQGQNHCLSPAPMCRCALCHQPETAAARRAAERFEQSNMRESGPDLGALLLVKTSAITNAWAHAQCLFWSPDVYVDGEGEDKHLAGGSLHSLGVC